MEEIADAPSSNCEMTVRAMYEILEAIDSTDGKATAK